MYGQLWNGEWQLVREEWIFETAVSVGLDGFFLGAGLDVGWEVNMIIEWQMLLRSSELH